MPSQSPSPADAASEHNLRVAVWFLIVAAFCASAASAYICGFVLDSFQSSKAMVMLITDSGLKSDDIQTERQLSAATLALQSCRDLGMALSIGCLGVGVAAFVRSRRNQT